MITGSPMPLQRSGLTPMLEWRRCHVSLKCDTVCFTSFLNSVCCEHIVHTSGAPVAQGSKI